MAFRIRRYFFPAHVTLGLFLTLTIIGVARGLQHYYIVDMFEPRQFGLTWHIPFNVFLWWSWFLFIPPIYWSVIKLAPQQSRFLKWIILALFFPLAVIFLRTAIGSFVISSVLMYMDFTSVLSMRLLSNVWLWLDIATYFGILIGIQTIENQQLWKTNILKLTQLQGQLTQSQLNALESQLRPHFLFNTLNTISTLILKNDTAEAERMLSLLQQFLRTTIYDNQRHEVTLDEELKFITHYLEIEKVRFRDKLVVEMDIEPAMLKAKVPNFLLQPIVENAIYHGIAARTAEGIVRIAARQEHSFLSLMVEDNGPGVQGAKRQKAHAGVGLKITRERLTRLFGDRQSLTLEEPAAGGVRVRIQIPLSFSA
jgi:two-component system, LytTR family, sensor kinase